MLGRTSHELADDRLNCALAQSALDRPRPVLRVLCIGEIICCVSDTPVLASPQIGDERRVQLQLREGLEAEAATISAYQAEIVPGLLQTRRYAAALHRAELLNATEEEIERHVLVRMQRQERLVQPDAPKLWVVHNEAVIRRMVGERSVMHEQLVKLIEAADAPNITLQVLPFSAGAHASMDSAFSIIGFDPPTDGEIVYFEHPTCSLYLEKADEVARYRLVYEHLRASSLSMDESRRMLTRTAEDMA